MAEFGGMGIADEVVAVLVPSSLYEVSCPDCGEDLLEATYASWGDEDQAERDLGDRSVACSSCDKVRAVRELKFGEPCEFARIYLWVSECERDSWAPGFLEVVESVLGECSGLWEWST